MDETIASYIAANGVKSLCRLVTNVCAKRSEQFGKEKDGREAQKWNHYARVFYQAEMQASKAP